MALSHHRNDLQIEMLAQILMLKQDILESLSSDFFETVLVVDRRQSDCLWHGLVEQCGDVLLAVAMRRAEYHHTVLVTTVTSHRLLYGYAPVNTRVMMFIRERIPTHGNTAALF